jgi:hypothetical protein
MKSGMRNIDSSGNCGPINSSKAQQRMVCKSKSGNETNHF